MVFGSKGEGVFLILEVFELEFWLVLRCYFDDGQIMTGRVVLSVDREYIGYNGVV